MSADSKACSKCGEVKLLDCFHAKKGGKFGVCGVCKPCWAEYSKAHRDAKRSADPVAYDKAQCEKSKKWAAANPGKIKKMYSSWAGENKDALAKRKFDYRIKNLERIKRISKNKYDENPDKYREVAKRYAADNPDKVKQSIKKWRNANRLHCNEYAKSRYHEVLKTDPLYRATSSARGAVARSITRLGYTKRSRTHEILGCDWEFFKSHIERQFLKGMDWEKMGSEIHIDHITPISTAKTEEDVIALNHFTNLRPIWAKDNLSKGAQITHLI